MAADSHWVRWHSLYDLEGSPLQQRLAIVTRRARAVLDAGAPDAPFRILSLCSGQGRDVIELLRDHPRRSAARVRLVELDPALVDHARAAVSMAGLDHVEVVAGDASTTDAAIGAVPADLVLACGIFGNIADADIRNFVELMPTLCAPDATVIWTRHRRAPDLAPRVGAWFERAGFDEVGFDAPDEQGLVGVGTHRLVARPRPFEPGRRLFTFVGDGGVC